LTPETFEKIPRNTAKAARAVFGRNHFYLSVGDHVNQLFDGLDLSDPSGRVQSPGRLGLLFLITIFQYIESMPDRQAADALRERLDWKYAMHLPLNYTRLEHQELCEVRRLCMADQIMSQDFQEVLVRLSNSQSWVGRQLQGVQTLQVISRVCLISRLSKIWETFNLALEALATKEPSWLLINSLPHWYERFGQHRRNIDLSAESPKLAAMAQDIGAEGFYLLNAVAKSGGPELAELSEIQTLGGVWGEQFELADDKVFWRGEACAGCLISGDLSHINQNLSWEE
jgi:hypothetical protein